MAVSTVGSWPVAAAVPGAVTVSIPDVTDFAATPDLRLVGWNGTQWVNLGQTATGSTEGSTLSGTIPANATITALGIGSVSEALPVTLGRFDVKLEGQIVRVSWDTHSEINNDYFEVMRSTNLQDWLPLGRVKGQGTTQTKHSYTFVDEKPLGGISYYQLRQVDFDKTVHTSPVRSVNNPLAQQQAGQVSVYPNPANNKVVVKIPQVSKEVTVQLFNASWQHTNVPAVLRDSNYELDVTQLTPGLYFLQITAGQGSQSVQKLLIQH
ncbi:T9SS type A sorting domain-containing protein [Siphonobacter sp. BAB-5385]|uniref:T9SS type A sorting domain-containing protein n=1 Tax=Siphonobacter sp. BAB-5385 TaxID=1864822 RepID=UPI00114073CF|nr:T9SS type A sorting domain-containing protein [Siphonobacter sp. BAB-5385]